MTLIAVFLRGRLTIRSLQCMPSSLKMMLP
jgi:hypothetical protein